MKFGNVTDWHTNVERAKTGVPLDLGNGRTLIVKRAGSRNREFMAAIAGIDTGDDAALYDVCARTLIVGWHGIEDENGSDIEFSTEACLELFRFAPEIADAAFMFAAARSNFRDEEMSADRSAVKKRSGGSIKSARTHSN